MEKFWRTLIRIDAVHNDYVILYVPAWNSQIPIAIEKKQLPEELLSIIRPNFRLHVEVNLAAGNSTDLKFKNWEWDDNLCKQIEEPISKVRNLITPIVFYFNFCKIMDNNEPMFTERVEEFKELLNKTRQQSIKSLQPLLDLIKNDEIW